MADDLPSTDEDHDSEPLHNHAAFEALKTQAEAIRRALAAFDGPVIPDWVFAPLPRIPALTLYQDFVRQLEAANALTTRLILPPSFLGQLAGFQRVLTDGLRSFWPTFDKWKRDEEEAIEVLTSQGWWPHPYWPVNVMYEVLRLKREKKLRSLDRVISDSYEASRLRPMRHAMASWWELPEYRARRAILRAGFNAYKKSDYISAVSVWLPQIEGVMRGKLERDGLSPSGWKRALQRDSTGEQDEVEARIADIVTNTFWAFFYSLYDTKKLQSNQVISKRQFPIRRDLVLHGVDLRYGRRANAMRIFLMLDTLHYFIIEYDKVAVEAA